MTSQLDSTTSGAPDTGRQLTLDLTATEPATTERLLFADTSASARLIHELITPLAVIMGALEMFHKHDTVPDDKRTRLLEIAIESGRELNSLIHSLVQHLIPATPTAHRPGDGPQIIRLPLN
ncbi:MAG: histidine kinase dimerization/phospho-acceptor domain-containing protein [Actinomycetota bacterium]